MSNTDIWYSVRDIAELLTMDKRSIELWRTSNRLPFRADDGNGVYLMDFVEYLFLHPKIKDHLITRHTDPKYMDEADRIQEELDAYIFIMDTSRKREYTASELAVLVGMDFTSVMRHADDCGIFKLDKVGVHRIATKKEAMRYVNWCKHRKARKGYAFPKNVRVFEKRKR